MNCGCRRDESSADNAYDVIRAAREEARRLEHYDVYQKGYQDGRKSLTLLLEHIIDYWNCGEVKKLKELEEQNEKRLDLLREVSKQGIESDITGIDYLTVQIDRELWKAIQEEIER